MTITYSYRSALIIGVVLGLLGGAACMPSFQATIVTGPILMGAYGGLFGLLTRSRVADPGSGLMWGLGYAFIVWLAVPAGVLPLVTEHMTMMGMLDTARAHFPALVAYVLSLGMLSGIALGTLATLSGATPM